MDFEIINNNCTQYLSFLKTCRKGTFLIREVNDNFEFKKIKVSIDFRKPRNMPIDFHNLVNDYFFDKFGWKVRNGVFCYGSSKNKNDIITSYGVPYLFFPSNHYKYVFDSNIFDLYKFQFESSIDSDYSHSNILGKINYQDNGLSEFINKDIEDGKSVEIIINCKEYFLVDMKFKEILTKKIWGRNC